MRMRDILIVAIALAACVFGWSREGSLNVQSGFVIPITDGEMLQRYPCKPIVADLDGNGEPVLIASTSESVVSVYPTHMSRPNLENVFLPIRPTKSVSVYSRVVGMGVGQLSTEYGPKYIAVVTEDYRLTLLSNDLTRMWETSIWSDLSSQVQLFHASVSVLPERVHDSDFGTVVVSVKIGSSTHTDRELFAAFSGSQGEVRWKKIYDDARSDGYDDAVDAKKKKGENEVSFGERLTMKRESGAQRKGLVMDTAALGSESARLPWTHFREAVVSALPHRHAHPWDTQLRPHVFFRAKNRATAKDAKTRGRAIKSKDNRVRQIKNDYGVLGEQIGLADALLRKYIPNNTTTSDGNAMQRSKWKRVQPNVLVFHTKAGMRVIHLYTGDTVTTVFPLREGNVVYHDINDNYQIDAIATQIGPRTVHHSRHGVDLVDDCLGVITSGIPMSDDEMYNATICDTQGLLGNLDFIHHFIDGDVHGQELPHTLNTLALLGSRNTVSKTTRSVPPVVVQYRTRKGYDLYQVERTAVFMIDSGLVTCVDPSRQRVLWRLQTDSSFANTREAAAAEVNAGIAFDEEHDSRVKPFPHLAVYSLHQVNEDSVGYVGGRKSRYLRTDPFVLAVGEKAMTVVNSRSGQTVRSVELESSPTTPVIVVDFNGDGSNDIVLITKDSIRGFIVTAKTSSDTVTALMLLMVGLLVLLVVARELSILDERNTAFELPTSANSVAANDIRKAKRASD